MLRIWEISFISSFFTIWSMIGILSLPVLLTVVIKESHDLFVGRCPYIHLYEIFFLSRRDSISIASENHIDWPYLECIEL
jgi:hypothetical protein